MFFKSTTRRDGYIDMDFYQSTNNLNTLTENKVKTSSSSHSIDVISIESPPQNIRRIKRSAEIPKKEERIPDYNDTLTNCIITPTSFWPKIYLFCYVVFYISFIGFGALSFQWIEAPVEVFVENSIHNLRNEFLLKHKQVNDAELEEFLQAIITANNRGISPLRNASNERNWSFGQAFFFSSTVITTIGYGRVTPLTQTGKIFCIIYATIGIPLTLVLLSAIIERLLVPGNWLLFTLNNKLGHLYQPFNIRIIHLTIIVLLAVLIFFAIPTVIFAYLEQSWGFLDAFYYCFISLTTIGLGDYIPGEGVALEYRSVYKMGITAYLILGLVAVMFVLTVFYEIPQLNLGQLFTENTNKGETEKLRLSAHNNSCYSGHSVIRDDQLQQQQRTFVRIRPHFGDDTPSIDETPF